MAHLPPAPSDSTTGLSTERRLVAGEFVDGKYELIKLLARGGMSRVWLARHESLKTDLAIKFVDEKLLGDAEAQTTLERFRLEAQISARLGARSKHVVAAQDAGSWAGMPYLVMEYVAGHTLEEEIEKGPIDPERLAAILEQVGDALAVAHELGIVHRDMKPSNIVIVDTAEGELFVKIADFGVAKATRHSPAFDRPTETSKDLMVGSPAYMSPEQLRAGETVDARTDVWGMGLVAFEMLTGTLPFEGVTVADLIVLVSTAPHNPISNSRPDLASLDPWFDRALAKEPAARFASTREAAAAFRVALAPKAPSPRKVTRVVVAAAAAVSLALVVTLAVLLRSGGEAAARASIAANATAEPAAPSPSLDQERAAASASTVELAAPAAVSTDAPPSRSSKSASPRRETPRAVRSPEPRARPETASEEGDSARGARAHPQPAGRKEIDKSEIQ